MVLGHEAERLRGERAGLRGACAITPDYTGAPSGSLHLGLERLPADVEAVVVLLADMVLVTRQMLDGLVAAAWREAAPLFVSRYGDVTAPPLLFRRSLFGELMAWTGEGCGKAVVQRHKAEAVYLDWPPAALADVDTPEGFTAVQALIAHASRRRGHRARAARRSGAARRFPGWPSAPKQ